MECLEAFFFMFYCCCCVDVDDDLILRNGTPRYDDASVVEVEMDASRLLLRFRGEVVLSSIVGYTTDLISNRVVRYMSSS
mmetsp:Transcript_28672/g.42463  ORF Transcript_28672/g.42463 Transcript_28672/m.42463 type:complete len:80 (-) Transcript_28672:6-245(-)